MKNYFDNLFSYDLWANKLILKAMEDLNEPKSLKFMAHVLAAQQIWLNRCKSLPAPAIALWPDWPLDTLLTIASENNKDWLAYLNTLQDSDFEKVIVYKNSKGESFQTELTDILAHVINHGTHHRAQAGQHLKLAGLQNLPNTDYIFYLRETQAL